MLARHLRRPMQLLLCAVACSMACAQTVHTVAPGSFAQISGAIAAASPGDIIKVASGTYYEFTCNKAVTIAAMPGANVVVYPAFSWPALSIRFQVPQGSSARVRGVKFLSLNFLQHSAVEVTSGTVAFEQCEFVGELTIDQCLLVQNASVSMRDCSLDVGDTAYPNPAVRLIDAQFAAVDSAFAGSNLVPDGWSGAGAGIWATNSALHLVRCDVRGGDTNIFSCFYPCGDGVLTDRGDLTWIADSDLVGGSSIGCVTYGIAGAGLRNTSATAASLTRTTTTPGTAATASQATVGPTVEGHLVGLAAATTEIQLNAPFQVSYHAEPNEPLFVLAALDLRPQLPLFSQEATWLPVADVFLLGVVTTDAAGLATYSINVPSAPFLDHSSLWLHAAALATAPWRIGPPVGGVMR